MSRCEKPLERTDKKGLMGSSSIECCDGKVLQDGWQCCKNNKKETPYNPKTHCCSDNKVFQDTAISSGIKLCEGPIDLDATFSVDHEWIEVDGSSIGFATGGSIYGSWGEVRDDSSYGMRVEGEEKFCSAQKINPCDYDIEGIKNCILSDMGATYWYIVGIRDCSWWVSQIFTLCKEGNKRKRQ